MDNHQQEYIEELKDLLDEATELVEEIVDETFDDQCWYIQAERLIRQVEKLKQDHPDT